MKKKATLLIKNIDHVYTMKMIQKNIHILKNAYIAIHHDIILACSCGDYTQYVDSDTRIIDAMNHIVIPSFIEPSAELPVFYECERVRKEMDCCVEYMRNGTLTVGTKKATHPQHIKNYNYEIMYAVNINNHYPILHGSEQLKKAKKVKWSQFCLSSASTTYPIYNQLIYAQMLSIKEGIDKETLLKALTIYPAKRLCLKHLGSIEAGKQADLLILSCHDVQELFQTFGNTKIAQIVKKGVRIYPFLLI